MTTEYEMTLQEINGMMIPVDECNLRESARKFMPNFVMNAATKAVIACGAVGFQLVTGFSRLDTQDKYTMADMVKFFERRRDDQYREGSFMLTFIREGLTGNCWFDEFLRYPECKPRLDLFNLHLEQDTVWMIQTMEVKKDKYLVHVFKLGLKGR